MKTVFFNIVLGLSFTLLAYLAIRQWQSTQPPNLGNSSQALTASPIAAKEAFQEGDLIFQTSLSGQSQAIQLATHSPYSHCGIIFKEEGKLYVFEAIEPVSRTPLDKWIARGKNGTYVVKRLNNHEKLLPLKAINSMKSLGKSYLGLSYDSYFEWSDENMYCSEYIWKIYQKTTGIELGKLQKLSDFDLHHPIVQKKLKQRYGANVPLEEKVISPAAIFNSELLMTVMEK